jgi:hypothetical protein
MFFEVLVQLLKILTSCNKTTLNFETSRGCDAEGGEGIQGGVTLQGVLIKDTGNGKIQWFEFVGAGMGIGIGLPAGGSISTEDFPSVGETIIKGVAGWGHINFSDLTGSGHIITISASLIGGIGRSLICFGEPIGDPLLSTGHLFYDGIVMGTPGAGIMCYKGAWYKVKG